MSDWLYFSNEEAKAPKGSVICSRTYSQSDWYVDLEGRVNGKELRQSHLHTYAHLSSIYVVPKYRNLEAVLLTSLAYMDNLKPDIFTFSVTVGPDHQGLALPSLSFQSFLKFPVGKQ